MAAKNSVMAPYGIDPFGLLAQVEASAPFTMGTVAPNQWAAYQGQLQQQDLNAQILEQRDQQLKEAKAKKDAYASIFEGMPEDATPEQIVTGMMQGARKGGDYDKIYDMSKDQASLAKAAAAQAVKEKSEAADRFKEIFKMASDNPAAAEALRDQYRRFGMEVPEGINLGSLKKPEKPEKGPAPSKTITTRVGKDGFYYEGIKDPATGKTTWFKTDLEARSLGGSADSFESLLRGNAAATQATPTPAPTSSGPIIPQSFLTAPGAVPTPVPSGRGLILRRR